MAGALKASVAQQQLWPLVAPAEQELLFDVEDADGEVWGSNGADSYALQPLYVPTDVAAQLLASVKAIEASLPTPPTTELTTPEVDPTTRLTRLAVELLGRGNEVVLRRSLGTPKLEAATRTLRNSFLVVRPPGGTEDLVVETRFSAHFVIAPATPAYNALLARLPAVFVGGRNELLRLVRIMSAAADDSFRSFGLELPPWRSRGALLSKWLPQALADTGADALLDAFGQQLNANSAAAADINAAKRTVMKGVSALGISSSSTVAAVRADGRASLDDGASSYASSEGGLNGGDSPATVLPDYAVQDSAALAVKMGSIVRLAADVAAEQVAAAVAAGVRPKVVQPVFVPAIIVRGFAVA